jgi:general secretion pathway protein A
MAQPVTRINPDSSACMYTEYFKLIEPPFSLTPDPRYLFMSERHREGLAHLFYGVQQPGGFVQLTGEIGCGKTTLSRCLVRQLPPETDVALILNPRLTAIELLATVCDELRIPYSRDTSSIKVLIDALNHHLLESHAQHRRTVLIIDEAQNLEGAVLEQIRLLTNLETSQEKLLQIILIGQPELLSVLKRKELRQIAQRITARYHLLALSRGETYAYVHHRLLVAGRKDPLFTASAMRCVYRLSGGVPRLINILCDRALLGAYALDKQRVSAAIVRHASRETRGIAPWHWQLRPAWLLGIVVLLALIAAGIAFFDAFRIPWFHRGVSAVNSAKAEREGTRAVADPGSSKPSTSPAGMEQQIGARDPANPATVAETPAPAAQGVSPGWRPGMPNPQGPPVASPAGSSGKTFTSLLSDSSSAFSDLYASWGLKPSPNPAGTGCKAAQEQGFECLFLLGSWPKLRRYDLPAILEILLTDGTRKRAALISLNQETATFAVKGHEYEFPLSEVDRVWDGSFILLWRPPFIPHPRLAPGASGEQVLWVRRALDTIDGKVSGTDVNPVYDDDLRRRVLRFQRDRLLIQDGFVGNETLVRLALALEGPNVPSLSRGNRQRRGQ